jgi:C4-dicarboxylate-specific signal transduction histidine kinase
MTGLLLGVTVDEWRFASERLARSHQLTVASEMATALAHELNQPLTALSTYADAIRLLAASPQRDAASLTDVAERIQRVASRSACIVGRLRSLGSTCRNRIEPVPLEAPLHDALAALAERTTRAGATVEIERLDALPPVRVDRGRITFVFQNLLRNALDAVEQCPPDARKVVITLRREDATRVGISVRDTGPGVSADMAETIFEPFHSGKAMGMGLGLALSRSIVESHGGRLWPEPGRHGLFHVRLPL